ncbi:hypothetical protein GCM10009623_09670 [Nocardioides aestuarii]|uniref:Uncharacterized protein n=1 Tax=Nocardioides aestuarii TaxID=252231 RepID=A0ABW4TL23_9ACTN
MSRHDEQDGQVSEVGNLDEADADTPIQPDQSVAGAPDAESGEVDEGPQGPNARPEWEDDPGDTDTRS